MTWAENWGMQKRWQQNLSTFSTKNFRRGKRERKEVFAFCLSILLAKISYQSLWPGNYFTGCYLKTIQYALPLFFLTAKTSADYQFVATVINEHESIKQVNSREA